MTPLEILKYYESQALAGKAFNTKSWLEVASASQKLGLWKQAIKGYTQALQDEQYAQKSNLHFNLGVALTFEGYIERAIEHVNQAITIAPKPLYFKGLADALSIVGEADLAIKAYQNCLRESKYQNNLSKVDSQACIEALNHCAQDLPQEQIESSCKDLEIYRQMLGDDPILLSLSYYVEAKLLKRQQQHEEAFRLYQQGGMIHSQFQPFNWEEYIARLQNIKSSYKKLNCSSPNLAAEPGSAQTARPIFIVGMPRSGTTLTEQILSRHSQVIPIGETGVLYDVIKGWSPLKHIDIFKKPKLDQVSMQERKKWESFKDSTTGRAEECLNQMRSKLNQAELDQALTLRFAEKTPSHHLLVGWIHQLFPYAKIIHCRRDPVSNCYSCFTHHFAHDHTWSYTLDEVGLYYLAYEELMSFWKKQGIEMHELHLEALTQQPEAEIRALLEFCDLEWEDTCLSPEKAKGQVYTASLNQVRKPIAPKPKTWRHVAQHLQPLQELLNLSHQERAELFS